MTAYFVLSEAYERRCTRMILAHYSQNIGLTTAAPVLDVTDELMRLQPEHIPKEARPYFRDIHDHVMRLVATADEMREMLTAAMQVNLAFISIEQNESVRRLAGWGGHPRTSDRRLQPIRHELQAYAGAGLPLRLPPGRVRHLRISVDGEQSFRLNVNTDFG